MRDRSTSEAPTEGNLSIDAIQQGQSALLRLAEACLAEDGSITNGRQVELLERLLGPEACRRMAIYRLPSDFQLSVIIPVFNERGTLPTVIERVRCAGIPCEIIVVDDGSTDGTTDWLNEHSGEEDLKVVLHDRNRGKGAALRTGWMLAKGDVVIVQDADLEYNPSEYRRLIQPIVEGRADVVYGSRFPRTRKKQAAEKTSLPFFSYPFWHRIGNRSLTSLCNLATSFHLTDVETCYKAFSRDLIQKIAPDLRESGFGIEIEVTLRLSRQENVCLVELPISYAARSYDEGKKIRWVDGLRAIWCVPRYRFWR